MQETQETQVQSLGWEDPLEEDMATHSSYSSLEKSMDRGAWQATIHGVAKSWTYWSNLEYIQPTSDNWCSEIGSN